MAEKLWFHVDVNSAFLSWTAAYRVHVLGETSDLRTIPSVVAGNTDSRHSIILAKSGPAKKFGIKTGEPLGMARDKCPGLVAVEPDYALYVTSSRALIRLLGEFSPIVEQYSIDEAWVDMTGSGTMFGSPVLAAETMKNRIREQLGFTVNIGVSTNKLLAKMAGDFEKPDKVHTLFPGELEEKMWPLPVRDLFSVGPATERKLREVGITTIGELAQADVSLLRRRLYKQGEIIWHFANGRCDKSLLAPVTENKGYGNSMTTPWDVTTVGEGEQVLLSLCETVGMRLRRDGKSAALLAVHLRTDGFSDFSRQIQMPVATDITEDLYRNACRVFEAMWDHITPLRQIGVRVGKISRGGCRQQSMFDTTDYEKKEKMDAVVDAIRERYGENAIQRARLLKGGIAGNMAGGLSKNRRTGITKPLPAEGRDEK